MTLRDPAGVFRVAIKTEGIFDWSEVLNVVEMKRV